MGRSGLRVTLLLCVVSPALQGQALPPQAEVVVVGGGAAGLSAAWFLRDRGVILLEKEAQVGGRALNLTHGPFQIALGTEYLGPPEGVLAELLEAAELRSVPIPSPMDVYWHPRTPLSGEGDFWWGNSGLGALHQALWNRTELNAFLSLVRRLSRQFESMDPYEPLPASLAALDRQTALEWMRSQKVPEGLVDRWQVTARGLFGVRLESLSALAWLSELAFDLNDSGWQEADLERHESAAAREPSGAYGLPEGIAQLPRVLAEKLGPGIVKTGWTVTALSGQPGDWSVHYRASQGGPEGQIKARAVVLAVPAPLALSLGGPHLRPGQRSWLADLRHAPFVVAALLGREALWNRAFDLAWRPGSLITDLYDATWVQRRVQPALGRDGHQAATVYLAATDSSDQRLQSSDGELVRILRQEIETLWPGSWSKVQSLHIQRHQYGYPVFEPGRLSRLSSFWRANSGSLVVVGDATLYPTFEAALESGKLGAEEVREGLLSAPR